MPLNTSAWHRAHMIRCEQISKGMHSSRQEAAAAREAPIAKAIAKRHGADRDAQEVLDELSYAIAERDGVSFAKAQSELIQNTAEGRYLYAKAQNEQLTRATAYAGGGVAAPGTERVVYDTRTGRVGKDIGGDGRGDGRGLGGNAGAAEIDRLAQEHMRENKGTKYASAVAAVLKTPRGRAAYQTDYQARLGAAAAAATVDYRQMPAALGPAGLRDRRQGEAGRLDHGGARGR